MGINLGAFLSPLICGTLGEKVSFHYGFAAAGVGMLIGLLIFMWGQNKYIKPVGNAPVCEDIMLVKDHHQKTTCDLPLAKDEKQRIAVIFIMMFFCIFFWASFEQAGSSLTLFAERSTDRLIPFLNWEFPVSYFQSVNPLLIILLAPLFSKMWLDLADINKNPSLPVKFSLGLFLVAVGFVLMVIASAIAGTGKVSFLWLIGVYLFHTLGELCISPVGLSMVTKLAPLKFASLLMGTWFLSSFFANFIAGYFAGSYDNLKTTEFFLIPVVLTGISAILILFLTKLIKKWMHGVE